MGNVEPMLQSTQIFLIGRGYQPDFSKEDWRRLAYVMTQTTLQADENMAARQQGQVVLAPLILSCQYEVQNTNPAPAVSALPLQTPGMLAEGALPKRSASLIKCLASRASATFAPANSCIAQSLSCPIAMSS